jgi:urate oxidase
MERNQPTFYSSRSADKFVVRLPDGMRDQIYDAAKENNRSMNSEIITRLQDSMNSDYSSIDVEVAPWTPVERMMVTLRKGEYAGDPLILIDLRIEESGVSAVVQGSDGIGVSLLSELKPYLLK